MNKSPKDNTGNSIREMIVASLDPQFTYLVFEKAKELDSSSIQEELNQLLSLFEDDILNQIIHEKKQNDLWFSVVKLAAKNQIKIIDHISRHLRPNRISLTVYNRAGATVARQNHSQDKVER